MRFTIQLLLLAGLITVNAFTQTDITTIAGLESGLRPHTETVWLTGEHGGVVLCATRLAARVMGLSLDGPSGENLVFVHPEVGTPEFWESDPRRLTYAGGWRTKISPQRHFYFEDGHWRRPPAMDPGNWRLISSAVDEAVFANLADITDTEGRMYRLDLRRRLRIVGPPVEALDSGIRPGDIFSVECYHTVRNAGDRAIGTDLHQIGLWMLIQAPGPGYCIMPVHREPGLQAWRDHARAYLYQGIRQQVQPISEDRVHEENDLIWWSIDGELRGKIGIHSKAARPAYAFYRSSVPPVLYVLQYPVDPEGLYVESPQYIPYDHGEAMQIYVGAGAGGGFAGMQVHGPARPLPPGESMDHRVVLTVCRGNAKQLRTLCAALLDVSEQQLPAF